MPDIFDQIGTQENIPTQAMQSPRTSGDIFDQIDSKEGKLKSIARFIYQIPSGAMQAISWPLDILNLIGTGEALDPEEIEQIEKVSQRAGIPFDREKYLKAVQTASSTFPTQSNVERMIEEKTGAPLTPQTKGQKLLKLGTTAATFLPGTAVQKGVAGITAPATAGALEYAGVPESLAEAGGLLASGLVGAKTPKISATVEKLEKPSGLPVRRFEKVTKPTEVSEKAIGKINAKLESDFKEISDKIISTSPIEKTKAAISENPAFKEEVAEQFQQVETLADQLPEKLHTKEVKKKLADDLAKKKGTGFAPGEYDKDYNKFMKDFIKDTPSQEIEAVDLVKQYRKNNKELAGAYDPSRSYNFNRAKKDALLDYNRTLADIIESKYSNSEFSNLFKETNKQWSEIADLEAMNKFIDGIFDKSIKFEKGKEFFGNENIARPFKRALGEEGFKDFKILMKDLLSSEIPYNMLKVAKTKGYKDLFNTGLRYIIHPKLASIKIGKDIIKDTYKSFTNALLDKPQLTIRFKKAVDELKKGDFAAAEKDFKFLDSEIEALHKLSKKETKY